MPSKPEALSRRWRLEAPPDETEAQALAAVLSLPLPLARLLVQRGFADVDAAKRFLRPTRDDLHDPFLLPDMAPAVERLARAVKTGETVFVHGDYDVDGQCAAAIMTRVIRHLGGKAVAFVPHRLRDGYDLSAAGVTAAQQAGAAVIVALDCGTTALEPVAEARRLGMDVIVADHHLPGPERPAALALVNPRRSDNRYPCPDLCGAGLGWKMAVALTRAMGKGEQFPWYLLDLAALATVADLVPLCDENRVIVRLGLRMMRDTQWIGLRALIGAAGLANRSIRAGQVAFTLGPRINAAGRIGDANDGLRLLLSDDQAEAEGLAAQLERQNAERQALDQRTLDEALDVLSLDYDPARDAGVVLAKEGWHPGVIGIVASRVVEQIARPVFMVALDGDTGKGSGRSVPRCDLHRALAGCADLLERWGGHKMAAGLTISRDRLDEFKVAFNEACLNQVRPEDLVATQRVDAVLALADLNEEFERMLRHLEPCGMGNPGPVFGLEKVALAGAPRPIGERHVRFVLTDGDKRLRTVAWGLRDAVEQVVADGGPLRAAVRLDHDSWLGQETVEGRLVTLARCA
jgi:single-stranded-DNA-specific exonuclease